MFRLLSVLALFALTSAAPSPAPKPVVVNPWVYPSSVYHPVHAPIAYSHVNTLYSHPPVLPYRTVLPAAVPAAPVLPAAPLSPYTFY